MAHVGIRSRHIPGRLNNNNDSPDNPASLAEPYSCAATTGLSDRKPPCTKPYDPERYLWSDDTVIAREKNKAGTCEERKSRRGIPRAYDPSILGRDKCPDEYSGEAGEHDHAPEGVGLTGPIRSAIKLKSFWPIAAEKLSIVIRVRTVSCDMK